MHNEYAVCIRYRTYLPALQSIVWSRYPTRVEHGQNIFVKQIWGQKIRIERWIDLVYLSRLGIVCLCSPISKRRWVECDTFRLDAYNIYSILGLNLWRNAEQQQQQPPTFAQQRKKSEKILGQKRAHWLNALKYSFFFFSTAFRICAPFYILSHKKENEIALDTRESESESENPLKKNNIYLFTLWWGMREMGCFLRSF